ncbi:uncharacterized protein LOC120067594 [Benincasa hispida]|uniref:uncharacterized protein LOC120067594 n=1 Tax=Benincasa hispida TaxID=102211 RepID=UPI0018FFD6D1|nr:uncharacterized protein LOC120067594 [Benincasa hispida]
MTVEAYRDLFDKLVPSLSHLPNEVLDETFMNGLATWIKVLCEKFKFKQFKSSMYNAVVNGLAEAFNKTLCNLLKKIVSKLKRDWQEKIKVTQYTLVYGVEVSLLFEREIPSLRIAVQKGLTTEDNAKLCLQKLEALDERRLEAQ